jgi:hypothetical protein
MPEGELFDAFRVCLEIAPERVTFFPQDFLKWRKVSFQRKAKAAAQQQWKREREERERAREVEREKILAEREDPHAVRVVKAAVAGLPWKRVKGGKS